MYKYARSGRIFHPLADNLQTKLKKSQDFFENALQIQNKGLYLQQQTTIKHLHHETNNFHYPDVPFQ